jgi:hypothetical protein
MVLGETSAFKKGDVMTVVVILLGVLALIVGRVFWRAPDKAELRYRAWQRSVHPPRLNLGNCIRGLTTHEPQVEPDPNAPVAEIAAIPMFLMRNDMIIPCPECESKEVELTGYYTWTCTKCSHEYFRPVIR